MSLLGGEPFQQPDGLLALVQALRARGCPHILCYSGYTYEALRRRANQQPAIGAVLDELDLLIDGPYVARRAGDAGPWTGSGNQRVLLLKAAVPGPAAAADRLPHGRAVSPGGPGRRRLAGRDAAPYPGAAGGMARRRRGRG